MKLKKKYRKSEHRFIGPKKYLIWVFIFTLFLVIPIASMSSVSADGGMISYNDFSVYEPGQKAIIAWDGMKEIMILSVDVYSEESTKALHMVPFPSLPDVKLGDVESFEELNEFIKENRQRDRDYLGNEAALTTDAPSLGIEIMFSEKIGPHDITAIQVRSPLEFTDWVNEFLTRKGITNRKMPEELDTVINHYIDNNIQFFAFDVIELGPNTKSVDPIVYTFRSEFLFFPLEISSIIEGETEITLALITPQNLAINKESLNDLGFYRDFNGVISNSDLEKISNDVARLFGNKANLASYRGYFSLADLKDDVVIKELANVNWMYTDDNIVRNFQVSDLNNDGNYEINLATHETFVVVDAREGQIKHNCKLEDKYWYGMDQKIADVNLDGILDVIKTTWDNKIYIYDGLDGSELWSFRLSDEDRYNRFRLQGLDIIEKDDSAYVCYYTYNTIYLIDVQTGNELWKVSFDRDLLGNIKNILIDDIDHDGNNELLVLCRNGIVKLNIEDGNPIWNYSGPIIEAVNLEVGNINDNPEKELVFFYRNKVYALDGLTGKKLWDKYPSLYIENWGHKMNLHDLDHDNKLEILFYSSPLLYVLDGDNGKAINEVELDIDEETRDMIQSGDIDCADLDFDGQPEIIGKIHNKIIIFDLENGEQVWEFSTGDRISYYDVRDIDDDDRGEIILVTDNMVYSVEYQPEAENDNANTLKEQYILIGSIVFPIILLVIIVLMVFRASEKHSK